MSNYRKSFAPTKDGFQEVWDSMQDPSIEQLIAGIQSKKPTKEQMLEKIKYFRDSRSTLDTELYHLSDYAEDYNSLYAAKNTYHFGTTEGLQNRTRSQCKRWSDMLELTSPRFNKKAVPPGDEQSVYKASYLTQKPYEPDLWGPASYGTLVYDLKTELDFIVSHMEDGEHMCRDVMAREEEINNDPERKKQLYEKQYREEEERNQESIDDYCREGNICADNALYKKMLDYETRDDFINDNFHGPSSSQFARYVIVDSTLKSLQSDITPLEKRLLGFDFEKVLRVRKALSGLDDLLEAKPSGQFEPLGIVQLIRWCGVLPSTKNHHDNEREFYEKYLVPCYRGQHTWPAWNTIFTRRKDVGDDERQRKLDVACFEVKFGRVCGAEK
ncbi:MAG: hypothetical protein J6Z14_09895 [Prevotella sp.]|nr:hypothetical protein [Prevotella sp.]